MRHKATNRKKAKPANTDTAKRMQALIAASGLSAAELARRIDVHANTIANWTSGKSAPQGAAVAYLDLMAKVRGLATT